MDINKIKLSKEVEETLKSCREATPSYERSEDGGDLINQGWIEALEYVLNQINTIDKGGK